ncbi:sodium/glucose cotransporter 5-like isoform X3 [Penaeus chinensis]|uniref:sodium/glucose cotransporter 5-like isoform X3 n=1 Tax=Penaeus chinensis TaxID=139456 RepID=UPI001FB7FCB6|nr:sodium/glucose cotransporter 5-like isoform X3 [Penaeus chinensis]
MGEGTGSDYKTQLGWPDALVVVLYFAFVLSIGLYSSWRTKRGSVSSYFLASRNMHWIPVGASLFASNIGSGHFIGLAGSGAASGIGIGAFELNAIYVLMLLGWIFVPVYMSSGVYTMPEYLRERFGGQRIRIYLSVLALILYVFTKISADLYAGALFIQTALDKGDSTEWLYLSILILLAIAALFTITGGLTAVIWTDFVQTILMIIGAFILMGMSFNAVGGYNALVTDYFHAIPTNTVYSGDNLTNCGEPPAYAMDLFRSIVPGESDLPWTGMLFGVTISGIWYWCTDQVIVQRTLSSKNMVHAKAGCVLAAALKFLPMFLLVFPGMAARILFPDRVACVVPEECDAVCGSTAGCTNIAYIELVLRLLPTGLCGLMLAVMMAALMSSLTSIFNSASTIFTIDIWTRIRRGATDIELLIVGRAFVLVLVVISVIWIPVIQGSANSQLFVYIQSISSFLSPPICAVYLLAIFWPRTTEPGAFWGLMIGLLIGLIRFIMEYAFVVPPCGSLEPDPRPEWIKIVVGNVHYLHFGCILFVIVLAVTVVVSYLTEPIPEECLHRLTFWTRSSTEVRVSIREWSNRKKNAAAYTNEVVAENGGGEVVPEKEEAGTEVVAKKYAEHTSSVSSSGEDLPLWRRALNCVCGVETQKVSQAQEEDPEDHLTPEQKATRAAEFLQEKRPWTNVVDGASILVMCIAAFMWGYYA